MTYSEHGVAGQMVVVLQCNLHLQAAAGHMVVACGASAVSSCQEGQSRGKDLL